MISQGKRQHTPWQRSLAAATLVAVTLACNTTAPPSPTPRSTAPSQTPVPTWTPTPQPTTGEIRGQIVDSGTGSPVPGANVYTDPPTVSVTADEQGRYVIPDIAPRVYTITATKPGYSSNSASIAVAAGKTTTADIHLVAGTSNTPIPTLRSPLADGLAAYYPFNGDANDESGSGNHGTVYGATLTGDRFGTPNSAYSFDGVDDYIMVRDSDIGDSLDFPGDQISLAAWVKFNSSSFSGSNQAILGKNNNKGTGYYLTYDIVTEDCEGKGGALQHTLGSSVNFEWCESENLLQPNRWYHIVLTYDGTVVQGHINGVVIHTSHKTGNIGENDLDFYIGRYTAGDFLNGTIDDVRIYDRALNEAEVQALYREGGWSPGSALSWPGPSSNRATSDTSKLCLPPMLLPANRPTGNRTDSQSRV
jgi:hypothetical protein